MLKYQDMKSLTNVIRQFKTFRFALLLPTFLVLMSFIIVNGDKELKFGKKVPLTGELLENIDGNSHSLESLKKEHGLIVIFSCNTCPFVVGNEDFEGWEKQYNDLYDAAQKNGLGLVLINSNEAKRDGDDSLEKMKSHAAKANYKMHYLVDKNSELANAFGAKTTPHVFVINNESKLVYKGSIDNIWDSKRINLEPYLYETMAHLSEGKELKNNDTPPRGCSIKRL